MGTQWRDKYQTMMVLTITDHIRNSLGIQDLIQVFKLTENEVAAIVYYTVDMCPLGGEWEDSPFRVLNSVLVTRKIKLIESWKPYIYYLLSGLNKLPPVQKIVYRAIDKSLSELSKQYSIGAKFCWIGFTSTSLDRKIVDSFIGNKKGTFMLINVTEGKDISLFSIYPEKEVLLLPNSQFIVDQILTDKMKLLMKLQSTVDGIILNQIPTPPHLLLMKQIKEEKENIDLSQKIKKQQEKIAEQENNIMQQEMKIKVLENQIVGKERINLKQEMKLKELQDQIISQEKINDKQEMKINEQHELIKVLQDQLFSLRKAQIDKIVFLEKNQYRERGSDR
jgi:hypothetical protein